MASKFCDKTNRCSEAWWCSDMFNPNGECEYFKPITNADKIRSMSDEDLANEVLEWLNALYAVEWTYQNILDYLKQEATCG